VTDEVIGPTLCPSAPAEPGAALIGIVEADGRVANVTTPLVIDAAFIAAARASGGPPEERFRFSSPCQQERCGHWTGRECGLIGHLHRAVAEAGKAESGQPLPRCSIRASCRWWLQRGREACAICPLIVTDIGSVAPSRYEGPVETNEAAVTS